MYHYFPKSVYYLFIGMRSFRIKVYSKLALVSKPRIPVLTKTVRNTIYIILLTLSDSVSYPMKSIKPKVKFLTTILTTETKTVTIFERIKPLVFKLWYYVQSSALLSLLIVES